MKGSYPFGVSFYIRRNKRKAKDYSIYCCIKVPESTPRELCIAGGIKRENWDIGKAKLRQTSDELIKLALYLDQIKSKLVNIYLDLKLKQAACTAENIKSIYLDKGIPEGTILQLINAAIKKYGKELTKGSLKNYGATRSYVDAFCKMKYNSGDIQLKSLTFAFIDELNTYILNNPLKSNDPCTNNGCMKHMERVKKMITWSYEMRFIDRNVFGSFKIRKNKFESEFLRWKQLKVIEDKRLQLSMLSLVRDLFNFCCYTGMAPVDMQNLQPYQIYSGADGIRWMSYTRAKSNLVANVPLLSPAIAIIQKYGWKKGELKRINRAT